MTVLLCGWLTLHSVVYGDRIAGYFGGGGGNFHESL